MKKYLRYMALVMIAAVLVAICAGCGTKPSTDEGSEGTTEQERTTGESTVEFPKMTLNLAHVQTSSKEDSFHKFATSFAEKIKEASNGSVNVEVFGNAQLGGERDIIEGMRLGTIDMAVVTNFIIAANNPASNMIELPFIFKDRETAFKFLDSDISKEISDQFYQKMNIKILGFGEGGFRNVLNNVRPIKKVADLKNMKIRLGETPMYIDTFKALGANPTSISFTETYTAVEQGTVDGMELPLILTYTGGYDQIHKYYSKTNHFFTAGVLTVSGKIWDSFNEDQKKVFMDMATEASIEQREFVVNISDEMLEKLIARGISYNDDVDREDFIKAVQPVYEKYRSLIGEDIYDRAMEFIANN